MGEANGRMNGHLIDTSIADRTLTLARKQYVKYLSERILVQSMTGIGAQPDEPTPAGLARLNGIAWRLAELHYEEMIRREADTSLPTLTERMAADSITAAARMVA